MSNKFKVLAMSLALVGYAVHDPTSRVPERDIPELQMLSSSDQASALFDNVWYQVGDALQGSDYSITSIDSDLATVVLSNGTEERTIQLWD